MQLVNLAQKWQAANMRLRLREIRKDRGLTIDQLAETSGLSRGFLSQLETGKRQPGADTILSLTAALDVPIAALVEDDGPGSPLSGLVEDLSRLTPADLAAVAQIVRSMLPKAP